MPGPFTTPVARSVPFDNSTNGFIATECQSAIEEARVSAFNNDLYPLLCSYNGNANPGRYLEFFPGIDSLLAPIDLQTNTKLLSVVAATTAATATCTIGFFNTTVSTTTPVYTITFTAQKTVELNGTALSPLATFVTGTTLAVRVVTGSINRPYIYFFLNNAS